MSTVDLLDHVTESMAGPMTESITKPMDGHVPEHTTGRDMRARRVVAVVGVALVGVLCAVWSVPAGAGVGVGSAVPEPKESIGKTAKRLVRALKSDDCQVYGRILRHSSTRVDRDDPAEPVPPSEKLNRQECEQAETLAGAIRGLEVDATKEYGTGALIDGTVDGETFTLALMLDVDRKYHVVSAGRLTPQIGSTSERDFAGATIDFVSAIESGDCAQSWRRLASDSAYVLSRVESGGVSLWCEDVINALSRGTGRIVDLVLATSDPTLFGATQDIGFAGIELPSGRYMTFLLFSQPLGETEHADPGVFEFVTSRLPAA